MCDGKDLRPSTLHESRCAFRSLSSPFLLDFVLGFVVRTLGIPLSCQMSVFFSHFCFCVCSKRPTPNVHWDFSSVPSVSHFVLEFEVRSVEIPLAF